MRPVRILGRGLWAPGFRDWPAFAQGARDGSVDSPACDLVPSRKRRGTSLMTRMAVEVGAQAVAEAGVPASEVAIVFGSHHGEIQIAIDQLAMMHEHDGLLSPARFKNSVHNTGAGVFSIATDNRGFATAIAAGFDTLAMTLLEAIVLLEHGVAETALVVLSEESVPEPFKGAAPHLPLAAGIVLGRAGPGACLGTLSLPRQDAAVGFAIDEAFRGNGAAALIPLFRQIDERRASSIPLSLEGGAPFCSDLDFGP